MSFILGVVGALLGVLAAIFIFIGIILLKVRMSMGKDAFKEIAQAMKDAKNMEKQEYARKKDIGGMTKLLEEPILRDFPDFNKTVLFSLIEKNLRKIFNAIETKSINEIKTDSDLDLMYSKIEEEIEDMRNNHIDKKYDNIVFHNHSIKKYEKKRGMATVTTATSLEYMFYSSIKKDKQYNDVKKQTRYICEFVYVYDEEKVGYDKEAYGLHCPNCGAPLRKLGAGNCDYCGMHVEPINLKVWKMISYKEDFVQ